MNHEHTQGPWIIDRSPDRRMGTTIRGGAILPGAVKPPMICRIHGGGRGRHADAVLIAAAPEMLAALRDARARLRALVGPSYDIDPSTEARRLDAVIDKATRVTP